MKEKIIAYVSHYVRLYFSSVFLLFATVMVTISLWSFQSDDLSFFYHATDGKCHNALGYFGATLAAAIVYLFGTVAYLMIVGGVCFSFFDGWFCGIISVDVLMLSA